MTKRIGYAKLGRSMTLDAAKYGMQGDAEAPNLLRRLAARNPDTEFVIIGKHSRVGADPFPSNVIIPWPDEVPRARWNAKDDGYFCSFCKEELNRYDPNSLCSCARGQVVREWERYMIGVTAGLDGVIMHSGQHGTTNVPIPQTPSRHGTQDPWTSPQVWARNYAGSLVEGLNALGDRTDGKAPVVWVCTDPRNYLKARDVKWPTGMNRILAQYQFTREQRQERYLDPRKPSELGFRAKLERGGELWLVEHKYRHAGLELMMLPDDWGTWGERDFHERFDMGVASTGTWSTKAEWRRSWLIRNYVFAHYPDADLYGKFDAKSLAELQHEVKTNTPEQFPLLLGAWKATIAMPPHNRGNDHAAWTAAKPYQCFAARSVCFFLGDLDKQGWIIPSRHRMAASHEVAPGLWSVRDGWTDDELYLARWLRIETPDEFAKAAAAVMTSEETWTWVTNTQLALLHRHWDERVAERTIEHQLGIGDGR